LVSITDKECLSVPFEPDAAMPKDDEELEVLALTTLPEIFHFIYDPMCLGVTDAQSPSWCKFVVDLFQKAILYKEWMHTLHKEDITVVTEIHEPEVFLLYTNELLKSI